MALSMSTSCHITNAQMLTMTPSFQSMSSKKLNYKSCEMTQIAASSALIGTISSKLNTSRRSARHTIQIISDSRL